MDNFLNSVDSSKTGEAAETTVFNSSDVKSYVAGKEDATLSAEGLFDGSITGIDSTLASALASSSEKIWTVWPQDSSTGNFGYGITAHQTAYDISTPIDDVVSISLEAQSNVSRDRLESIFELSTISTSSGTGATNTNSTVNGSTAGSAKGAVGYLQKTDTSTGTITAASIQHSSCDIAASFGDLVTFAAVGSTSRSGQRVATGSTDVKRYTRFKWTLGSSNHNSIVLNVGFSRI
jgi:hypothetical protein